MSIYSDFRFLSTKDIRHRRLSFIPDIWYKKHIVLVSYNAKSEPVSGVVLKEEICELNPDYDFRIYCWSSNLELGYAGIEPYLKDIVQQIRQEMIKRGKTGVWGFVPKYCVHLTTFLDKFSNASKCTKTDGQHITDIAKEPGYDYSGYYIYLGDRDKVANFTGGI